MKTAEELRETRRKQQERYRGKKKEEGLVCVEVWIPASIATKIKGKKRIGVVIAGKCAPNNLSLEANGPDGNWIRPIE